MSKMKMAETILCSSCNPMPALVTFTVLDFQPSESLCVTMAKCGPGESRERSEQKFGVLCQDFIRLSVCIVTDFCQRDGTAIVQDRVTKLHRRVAEMEKKVEFVDVWSNVMT